MSPSDGRKDIVRVLENKLLVDNHVCYKYFLIFENGLLASFFLILLHAGTSVLLLTELHLLPRVRTTVA